MAPREAFAWAWAVVATVLAAAFLSEWGDVAEERNRAVHLAERSQTLADGWQGAALECRALLDEITTRRGHLTLEPKVVEVRCAR